MLNSANEESWDDLNQDIPRLDDGPLQVGSQNEARNVADGRPTG